MSYAGKLITEEGRKQRDLIKFCPSRIVTTSVNNYEEFKVDYSSINEEAYNYFKTNGLLHFTSSKYFNYFKIIDRISKKRKVLMACLCLLPILLICFWTYKPLLLLALNLILTGYLLRGYYILTEQEKSFNIAYREMSEFYMQLNEILSVVDYIAYIKLYYNYNYDFKSYAHFLISTDKLNNFINNLYFYSLYMDP